MKALFLLASTILALPAEAAADPRPVQVMVVGSYHFANHNRDLHNVRSDDVLTPARQREIAVLVDELARWKPTKILVEVLPGPEGQRLTGPRGEFDPALLRSSSEERVQVGYRLAGAVRAPVYAINEQPEGDEPDYFPFSKVAEFAERHGLDGRMAALQSAFGRATDEVTASLASHSIPFVLAAMNSEKAIAAAHRPYLEMLHFGDLTDQPGAELYAYWMMRNAKIFGKAMLVAEPGDRVLVIYGAGHAYWLRHFASAMPGVALTSPLPYLSSAARKLGR